ncbi:MAG: hemolysin family protein [Lachnospiraceae bacterium]
MDENREDDTNNVIGYVVFVGLVILNMIFCGFRSAVDNLSDMTVDKMVEEGSKKASVIQRYLDEPTDFFYHIQMFTIFIISGLTFVETLFFFKKPWILAAMLAVFVFVGVFLPQKIASRRAEKWAFALVGIVKFFFTLFNPLYWLLDQCSDIFVRIQGLDPDASVDDVTEDEIISMVKDGHEQGVLQESEAEMIHNIFEFDDKEAKDIMTHRKHIVAIDAEMTLQKAIQFILEKNNSRFPVYQDDIDNILGMIHIKDVLMAGQKPELYRKKISEIDGLIREIDVIPETRNINVLFKEMQSTKSHIVVVVDEYGQTSGLVAMEDILEEIVGNILDEYDEEEQMIQTLGDGSFLMKGLTPLEEVQEALDTEFDAEDYETLNGFLTAKIDKIPSDGDTFTVEAENWIFSILSVKNKLIQTVKIQKKPKNETYDT